MKKIDVGTKKHTDVKGNSQLYLILSLDDDIMYINIGQKTYESANALIRKEMNEQNDEIQGKVNEMVENKGVIKDVEKDMDIKIVQEKDENKNKNKK